MRSNLIFACAALICGVLVSAAEAGDGQNRRVIYDGEVFELGGSFKESKDLWMSLKDLTRVTKFVLKPQGVCRDKLCYPIPKGRTKDFLFNTTKPKPTTWFNMSEFARLIHHPVAYDDAQSVWYFGSMPEEQNGYISSLMAPDFRLPDSKFEMHSLSDFRGKKVLLITWASW
jgi:hypothetical protein